MASGFFLFVPIGLIELNENVSTIVINAFSSLLSPFLFVNDIFLRIFALTSFAHQNFILYLILYIVSSFFIWYFISCVIIFTTKKLIKRENKLSI